MSNFFSKFPKVYYTTNDTRNVQIVTNITTRFALEEKFKENTSAFYNYTIIDGDTPEIIASKIYGSPERHWIILLMNDIFDTQYDWPLMQETFYKFIDEKYSSPEYADTANTSVTGLVWANSNIHSFYKTETTTNNTSVTEKTIQISENSFNELQLDVLNYTLNDGKEITIRIDKFTKSYFDYENELNENKRIIKLLKREFITSVERELELASNE
jgi:hypothetical protein